MIRILQVVPNMNRGGIETLLMNIYRNIDKSHIQFDFLVHHKDKGDFDEEILSMGGKIYYFSVIDDKNIFSYIKQLNTFFHEHTEYKIIHGHMASMASIYFGIAKMNGVNIRIAHSHGDSYLRTLKGYTKFFLFKFVKYFSTFNLACSKSAGYYLFKKRDFTLLYNGINLNKFEFNIEIRNVYRKKYNLTDKIVYGHIGRFNLQKNHRFLINIFEELYNSNKNSMLVLIGDGELKQDIIKYTNSKLCKNNVLFLGTRNDVENFYQAFDCFLLPSLFEGLPIVGIEAQAADLPCFFSEKISEEVKITDKCFFYPLENSASDWANYITENITNNYFRKSNYDLITQSGYNILETSYKLEKLYFNLLEGTKY